MTDTPTPKPGEVWETDEDQKPVRLLGYTAENVDTLHAETANRDRLIEKLADILGDFAVADEHSGERNDMQLARLLVGRGVTLAEAVDQ